MRRIFSSLLLFFCLNGFSQVKITNKDFGYFDLMAIENNHFQHQLLLSASLDEAGWNGEWYKIKKNFFSLNFSVTCKRLLPNLGNIWVPVTTQWQSLFPRNGILGAFLFKWYFNQQRFSFAGVKLYTGYLWTHNQDMYDYITLNGPSATRNHVFWANNFRWGFDFVAGRKFVNKLISEIKAELGYRLDNSVMSWKCIANCLPGGNDQVQITRSVNGFIHLQFKLGFDIFSR